MRDVEDGEEAELQGYRLEPVASWHVRMTPYPFVDEPGRFWLVRRVVAMNGRPEVLVTPPERVEITVES
jgi:hypothetical protein